MIIALDPGKNLGIAYLHDNGLLIKKEIIDLYALEALDLPNALLLVGNGTGSKSVKKVLKKKGKRFRLVDERGTSLEARKLYFIDHPYTGWQRLLPRGLWFPSRPIDDYAAYAIALKFLANR